MALQHHLPVFEGKVVTLSFLFSIASLLVMATSHLQFWAVAATEATYMTILALFFSMPIVQVIICSHGIGIVFAVGALVAVSGEPFAYFGFYAMGLAFFHISEYVVTAIYNAHTLSIDSFLINHSWEYSIAAIASWSEYLVEYYFFPDMKSIHWISWIGILLVVGGETLRKAAMFTAASNFTHLVQYRKRPEHVLVTRGVYSVFRHPSYVGWFYWSIGTQLVLCNPICLVGYVIAMWLFFSGRIYEEEQMLVQFFGEQYIQYKKEVGTGIPFVKGFPLETAIALHQMYTGKQ